ncbi:hypothetical protein BH23VER1_BH23VER1_14560 [soil metagenome]
MAELIVYPLAIVGAPLSSGIRMSWKSRTRALLRHPIMIFVVIVVFNRALKNEYPFNSFPMYAEPGGPSNYLIIADAASGDPIPVRTLTGFSSSDVKKMYIERRNKACDKLGISPAEAPDDLKRKVVANVVKKLHTGAAKRGKVLPEQIRLIQVDITQKGISFDETPFTLGQH